MGSKLNLYPPFVALENQVRKLESAFSTLENAQSGLLVSSFIAYHFTKCNSTFSFLYIYLLRSPTSQNVTRQKLRILVRHVACSFLHCPSVRLKLVRPRINTAESAQFLPRPACVLQFRPRPPLFKIHSPIQNRVTDSESQNVSFQQHQTSVTRQGDLLRKPVQVITKGLLLFFYGDKFR